MKLGDNPSFYMLERPLAVLRPKRAFCFIGLLIIVLLVPFFVFGVILPVLKTGDFASVWPVADKRIGYKAGLFFLGWFYLLLFPLNVPSLKIGDCYFYEDRMEIKPFVGWEKITYLYSKTHINVHRNVRMVISEKLLPSWIHPIQRYKAQYWNGFAIGIISHGLKDPEEVQKVLQILGEKASSLT